MRNHLIDIKVVNQAALVRLPQLLGCWLPDGKVRNGEWIARNPTRNDRNPGSFMINTRTGKWSDFATGDRGGDVVSLYAYLEGLSQYEAAKQLSIALAGGYA